MKQQATRRWPEIFASLGIQIDLSDYKARECPKCGGDDRFNPTRNATDTGKAFCRQCFNKDSTVKPGDGLATIAWYLNVTNLQAAQMVAKHLGFEDVAPEKVNIIEAVARDKRMPLDAFLQFNPVVAKRGKREVARVGVHNQKGEVHSYFDCVPTAVHEKGWFRSGEGSSGLFLPGRIPKLGETWILVEGLKDAAALIGLGFNACGLPTSSLADKYAKLFEGVHIVVVGDLDIAGQRGCQTTGANVCGIATSVKIARLPGEIKESHGDDVRDVLRRTNGDQLVLDAIANAKDWQPKEGDTKKDDRPEVVVDFAEAIVADQVVKHLGKLGFETDWIPEPLRESVKVYSRSGNLVQPIVSEDPGTKGLLSIRLVPTSILRERITLACRLLVEELKGEDVEVKPIRPPNWLVNAIFERGNYDGNIRPLIGVTQTPTIRPDGTILQDPGYDQATGLFYRPNDDFPKVPESPTAEDAQRACASLFEVVSDFPFESDSDKSAWLAMLLTMICRSCISGCTPLFAISATCPGSGKGLLADVTAQIAYGRAVSKKEFQKSDEELSKFIATILYESEPCHIFDNIDRPLRGAPLDAVLTTPMWKDRLLGQTKSTGDMLARTIWVATGNNISYGSDTARRVLPIRLSPNDETPEKRTEFIHKDLLSWVKSERPRLVCDALTIIRAFFVAGCPKQKGDSWGSFESWTATICAAIVFAGADDPMVTRTVATENDESKDLVRRIISAFEEADPERRGMTVRQMEVMITKNPTSCTGL
ncbi:MAG TPA: primase-helicase zinc-binding domain-containing protein, partial [Pirellula sp.]|nr:primase-helicase zinc-binding domain-containing protein [Pirellula sp.]